MEWIIQPRADLKVPSLVAIVTELLNPKASHAGWHGRALQYLSVHVKNQSLPFLIAYGTD